VNLEKVTSQVNGYQASTATHAGEVEALDVAPELVLVDDHSRQRRSGRKKTAIDNKNIYVLRLETCFVEQRIHGGEDNKFGFSSGGLHGGLGRDVVDCWGETCFFTETGTFENTHLELDALRVVFKDEPGVFHEGCEGDAAGDGWLEAGVVDEVDGAGFGHEVDGGDEDDEEGGAEDLDKVQVEGVPEVQDLFRA